ncbi:CpsD/CapB family tyrosine-protein kinase [Turicibacter bilis]|uniref:CpsD/CapB family tyrosine-protein kinase n=1 Tax=Turicibacter bilis TaxID=2735723 RepID=UPI0031BAEA25
MTNMPAIISLSNPKSPEAEAYRTLRTNLQFSTVDHALQTILVTSPNAAEGKTTTVCNLAVSFAQIGKKVLIIDGDLRRPRLHTYLGLSNTVGISNVLTQNLPVQEAMKESMLDIQVLTCGPIPPNPAELLNSNRLKELLNQLKQYFDIILIDTPPVGVVTDAAILSTLVDGTLMVIASHQTESDQAVRAMKLLQTVGAKVLGTVLTKVPADRKGYYGYQYYEYHTEASQKGHKSKKRRVR